MCYSFRLKNFKFGKMWKWLRNCKGFSLVELLISLAIFGILMGTVANLLVINIKVANRVKARTHVREETSFMLKILKKDIRNADVLSEKDVGGVKNLIVGLVESDGTTHCYRWFQQYTRIERKEINCITEEDVSTSYLTPADIELSANEPLALDVVCEENNCTVKINLKARTHGMPEGQWITKEVAASTRNFDL
jgi:prepilin-type N-terminal cleavage/methylation domain-containing protein